MTARKERVVKGGRPVSAKRTSSDVKAATRYAIVKADGGTWQEARRYACSSASFREWLLMKGRNPEDYLALVTNKQGGRPRTDPERGVRYRHLRTFGFTAAEASAISYNVGRYELTVRRLSKGIDPWL